MERYSRSKELYEEACRYIPGGVNSPVRAFRAVGGTPVFIKSGAGSRVIDEDGNVFIDYVNSWGALILGHAQSQVTEATVRAVERGTSFGTPTEAETTLARMIREAMPSVEKIRFVNSGTVATMSAIRVARAATGRDKIVKFAGCYHGHSDGLLARAGSGMATLGIPSSPGVPASFSSETLVVPYNDPDAVTRLFAEFGRHIAAVIVEPVAANMGVVLPKAGFLESLRALTRDHGSVLIFDEVITGFRVHWGGAQALFGITPDLTCLGKVIGAGLPVGAFGGRAEIMDRLAPEGSVYQAGTHSGNPVVMAAGIETLRILGQAGMYEGLEDKAALLEKSLMKAAERSGLRLTIPRCGSLLTPFFAPEAPRDYETALRADAACYAAFFHSMLAQGIFLPPSQFEASFVSAALTEEDLRMTIGAAERAFAALPRA